MMMGDGDGVLWHGYYVVYVRGWAFCIVYLSSQDTQFIGSFKINCIPVFQLVDVDTSM